MSTGHVDAATRFVSKLGSDAGPNNCSSSASPCLTINQAMTSAASGDVIRIASGKYQENLTRSIDAGHSDTLTLTGSYNATFTAQDPVNTPTTIRVRDKTQRALALTAAGAGTHLTVNLEKLTISSGNGSEGGVFADAFNAATLSLSLDQVTVTKNNNDGFGAGLDIRARLATVNLTITDSEFSLNDAKEDGGAIEVEAVGTGVLTMDVSRTLFDGNHAEDGAAVWVTGDGTQTHTYTGVTFSNNKLQARNAANNIEDKLGGAIGINTNGSVDMTFINNVFVDNHARGGGAIWAHTFFGPPFTPPLITLTSRNSTFSRNHAEAKLGGGALLLTADFGSIAAHFRNDILWGNVSPKKSLAITGKDVRLQGTGVTFDYDYCDVGELLNDAGAASVVAGAHNLNVDPLFVKITKGDIHLTAGSPLIDTGTCAAVPTVPTEDFEGDPRPNPSTDLCDIGADEFE
jgi:hypothetical protein